MTNIADIMVEELRRYVPVRLEHPLVTWSEEMFSLRMKKRGAMSLTMEVEIGSQFTILLTVVAVRISDFAIRSFEAQLLPVSPWAREFVYTLPREKSNIVLNMPFKDRTDYWTIERAVRKHAPKIRDFYESFCGAAFCGEMVSMSL